MSRLHLKAGILGSQLPGRTQRIPRITSLSFSCKDHSRVRLTVSRADLKISHNYHHHQTTAIISPKETRTPCCSAFRNFYEGKHLKTRFLHMLSEVGESILSPQDSTSFCSICRSSLHLGALTFRSEQTSTNSWKKPIVTTPLKEWPPRGYPELSCTLGRG